MCRYRTGTVCLLAGGMVNKLSATPDRDMAMAVKTGGKNYNNKKEKIG